MKAVALLIAIILIAPGSAWCTNGYFQHGIGVKEQSVGGAAIAFPQSAMSGATNPATLTAVGNRLDLGGDWFAPTRTADSGDGSGEHTSDNSDFLVPQLGYNYQFNDSLALALIVFSNGGMMTDWPKNFFGSTTTYSYLKQLFISPTLAYRLTPKHSIGISLNYVWQSFEGSGLQGFAAATPSGTTNKLSDQGEDKQTGWGVRLGYFGELTDHISIGAFWQPETQIDEFSSYSELFAEQGALNVPETYGVGIAITPRQDITLAADLVSIRYADIPALANPNNFGSALLGADNGPGFGWRNAYLIKLGFAYDYHPQLTLRAGWNHSNQPIRPSETTFNILSPATISDHLTLGASWRPNNSSEISLSYWHGFGDKVNGNRTAANGADSANLQMKQHNIGISYSWLF